MASRNTDSKNVGTQLMNVTRSRCTCRQNSTGDSRVASLMTTAAPPPTSGSSACSIEGSKADEISNAEEIVAVFEAQPNAGVLSVAGRMVDRPHLLQARRVLERAQR